MTATKRLPALLTPPDRSHSTVPIFSRDALRRFRHAVATTVGNRLGLGFMRLLSVLPLPLVRGIGWLLGQVLHTLAVRRRRIARTNWRLCFPHSSEAETTQAVRAHFVRFVQAWLDRSWLWQGSPALVQRRLRLKGDVAPFAGQQPLVLLAPHFVGLDAGWTALNQAGLPRTLCTIYAPQLNEAVDAWIYAGRQRFGQPHLLPKGQGLRSLAQAIKSGEPLYLLPDMDYGARDAVFVPFFGQTAATITSLSRFARLAGAQVLPVVSEMTPEGYTVRVLPVWDAFPTADAEADTARMNRELERLITAMPEQYFWVHKRFKTRPSGEPSVYGRD